MTHPLSARRRRALAPQILGSVHVAVLQELFTGACKICASTDAAKTLVGTLSSVSFGLCNVCLRTDGCSIGAGPSAHLRVSRMPQNGRTLRASDKARIRLSLQQYRLARFGSRRALASRLREACVHSHRDNATKRAC